MLGAVSYVLMFLEFPILPMFPFLKIDFSDVPVLIGTLVLGPIAGFLIAFVRSLLNFLTKGGDLGALIGNAAGLLASVAYLLPIYYIFHHSLKKSKQLLGIISGVLLMTIIMTVANYFIIMPLYVLVGYWPADASIGQLVFAGILPFNLIKGLIVGIVFFLIFNALLPWMQKNKYLEIQVKK